MVMKNFPSGFGSRKYVIDVADLGRALSHCWDLPMLQTNRLTRLPAVMEMALEEHHGLEHAKALRRELVTCAEQLTRRPRYSIEEIVLAIEKQKVGLGCQDLVRVQKIIGIRLPRNKIDLARYYSIRLVMEGIDQLTIAEFLDVDLRTVANYIFQAKERIMLTLDSKSMVVEPV